MLLLTFIAALMGLVTVLVAMPLVLAWARSGRAVTRASELHHAQAQAALAPVPRFGGLALALAFVVVEIFAALVTPARQPNLLLHPVIILSSLAMFALGFADDFKPLGARRKLLGQILIALAVCAFGLGIQQFQIPFTGHIISLGHWGTLITVLWLVAMTNLINLTDGVDGLAGGISLMLMVLLGYVGHETGKPDLVIAGMGGALLGFLRFNFPPARIYMGDGGAYFLGFQIGLFAIMGSHKGQVLAALAAPLFVLALPILDTSLAILRRGLHGLPLFRADRRHLHHRLLETGLSHRKVVLGFYGVTLMFLAMGIIVFWSRGDMVPILFGFAVLVLILCAGRFEFSRRWFAIGQMVQNSFNMRREIEYALCMTKLLEIEGRRHHSVEDLWSTLVIIVDKLGFTSVKLTLPASERVWTRPAPTEAAGAPPPAPLRIIRHNLMGGHRGILELKAPVSERDPDDATAPAPQMLLAATRQRNWARPALTDQVLFETMGELLAESWVRAANHYINGVKRPLVFTEAGGGKVESRKLKAEIVESGESAETTTGTSSAIPESDPSPSPWTQRPNSSPVAVS